MSDEPKQIDFFCKPDELDEINTAFYCIYEIVMSSDKYRTNPHLTALAFDHIIAKAMYAKETILFTTLDTTHITHGV